ncbi:MAG TPA: ERCC4 domain-containing protein [Nitrososphaerales archaeon]|nr:ERCC4 domain-containing protein [Nitrososphaerales archaeon]
MIPVRVVVDERERASGVPDELSKMNVRVYFSKLPVGDYVVSPEVVVERKTIRDLLSSIYDSRIFYQAAGLAATYSKPYLLIEGDTSEVGKLARNIGSYYGVIANVTLAYGLRLLHTADAHETATAIAALLHHARARPVTQMTREAPPRSKSVPQQQVYLVSSLPGIGGKLAQKLLLKYGTPRRVMGLTAGELSMTPGIGWKRAERIKALLDATYSKAEEAKTQTRLEE